MDCQINSWNKALLLGLRLDDVSSDRGDLVDQMPVVPEDVPKDVGHGERNVLPLSLWQSLVSVLHPHVSGLFPA